MKIKHEKVIPTDILYLLFCTIIHHYEAVLHKLFGYWKKSSIKKANVIFLVLVYCIVNSSYLIRNGSKHPHRWLENASVYRCKSPTCAIFEILPKLRIESDIISSLSYFTLQALDLACYMVCSYFPLHPYDIMSFPLQSPCFHHLFA